MVVVDVEALPQERPPRPPIRVMVLGDHEIVRAGITAVLSDCDDIDVVVSVGNALDALETSRRRALDVVLIDLSMPDGDGVVATALLVQRNPRLRVVVLAEPVDGRTVRAALEAGAIACLLKTAGRDELAEAIRSATTGRSEFSSEFVPHLLGGNDGELGGNDGDAPALVLTARERDVLALMAEGRTNVGMAETLGLAEGTVRNYVSSVLAKLSVANRTEAAVVALRDGLVDPSRRTSLR